MKREVEKENDPYENGMQLVKYTLGSDSYGMDIMVVESVIMYQDVTPVPRSPSYVEGIIDLRDNIVPIINLRKRLDMPLVPINKYSRVIIIFINGRHLGIIVDSVGNVMRIEGGIISGANNVSNSSIHKFVAGVVCDNGEMTTVLDMHKIFTIKELKALENI